MRVKSKDILKINVHNWSRSYHRKKKTFRAIWDESSMLEVEEQINKEEMINYTLITFNNEILKSPQTYLSYKELLKVFYELYDKLKKIHKKYNLLKKLSCLTY